MDKETVSLIVNALIDKRVEKSNHITEVQTINKLFQYTASIMNIMNCLVILLENNYIMGLYDSKSVLFESDLIGMKLKLPFVGTWKRDAIEKTEKNILGNIIKFSLYDFTLNSNEGIYSLLCISYKDNYLHDSLIAEIGDNIKKCLEIISENNKRFDIILRSLDSIDEGITICDKDGYLRYCNKSTINIMGYKVEEVLNKKMEDFSDIKPLLYQVIERKKRIIDDEYYFKFNGKTIHLINSAYPVSDKNGEVLGAIDIFRGIERSKKLANKFAGYNALFKFEDIIGKSNLIKEKIELAKIFSRTSENILIQGESGTGKELFAQSIHNFSNRSRKPFIAINCANFPNELIESELFGYEEGAFTGAKTSGRTGKFELANKGTLFLDEIGEMQLHLQAKLLRVIETKTINRIGGNNFVNVDVRIIAATNRKLNAMVESGQFRRDLYYRLKVLSIEIPPLEEREDDVIELTNYFLMKIGKKFNKEIMGIDKNAKEILLSHEWPGNIRELENLIYRLVFVCSSDYVTKEDLLKAGLNVSKKNKVNRIIKKKELVKINKKIVLDALEQTGGNRTKAAKMLGISRQTIYRMLK